MNLKQELNLQLFADAGTLVNASGNYVNAYSGETSAFPDGGGMTASMKTFYDTELLENARPELIHTQFARKQALPAGRGKTVEWRKWNTLEDAGALTEGVIPTGQKFGQSAVTQAITQYGTYVSVSDQLELHAIDDVILGAAEELGASAGTTQDKLVRNVAAAGTNVQYCDKVGTNGAHTAVTSRAGLDTTAKLTPDEVNKAVTLLKKLKAPKIDGKYIAIIHPSVAYDLRSSAAWIEAHKYAGLTELFTGEIGELHGVRFIETTEAKIFNGEGCPVKTAADTSKGTPAVYYSVYATLFLGKDAYGMIDPEGGNLEMIIKDKGQVGGPLNQFSTLGYKFSSAAKILYQDRMVRVESCGAYSAEDEANRGSQMETGESRSPEKTEQKRRIAMENAFAVMKTITLPRAGGTEQQSEFVCVNGRTFQVPRGKAVEVPAPVYEVLENARRQLEAARKIEDELAAG